MMSRVVSANSSAGDSIDSLKYWTSFLNSDSRPIAILALEEEEDDEETEAELKTKEKCSNTRKSLKALFAQPKKNSI
uniref:Uncharacterized protein n=1 Tax=Ditylenchus dipsaci TaxID=166011 RepID=A0A915CMT2_9BILA